MLEIGFGPGLGVQRLAALVPQGQVAGVDSSPVMLEAASRRNAAAIAAGRVELQLGSVTALPYADDCFDRGLAVQVINYLAEPLPGLREWRRVMKPGGRVAVFFEGPEKFERTRDMLAGIYTPYSEQEVMGLLEQAGFARIWFETRQFLGARGICVPGER